MLLHGNYEEKKNGSCQSK